MAEHCTFLRAGDLSAIVGDDTQRGPAGQQYSGLWSLLHNTCFTSPFQNAYAGLIAYSHRGTGPLLERIDETSACLSLTSTDQTPSASISGTYTLVPPHYIDYRYDVEFATGPNQLMPPFSQHGWCSYMNSPLDPSIHFIENNRWATLMPHVHGAAATVFPKGLDGNHRADWERRTGEARFAEQAGFSESFSGHTFDYPFYYGLIHGMVFMVMADCHRDVRFYISPSGAGESIVPGRTSPAWDLRWYIWDPKPGQRYTLNIRIMFCPARSGKVPQQVWREWDVFRQQYRLVCTGLDDEA